MFRRKTAGTAIGVALALTLAACGGSDDDAGAPAGDDDGTDSGEVSVGVALPTSASERWVAQGDAIQAQLEALGYVVDVQYAADDVSVQADQIETMVADGADVLVIAPVDGSALTSPLEQAAANSVSVIAYDRLIRDSEHVDFYAAFDNYQVGVQQATSLLYGLGLTDLAGAPASEAPAGPFNIEVFAGSPADNNATFVFNGAMDTFQPLIDAGTLVIPSGQMDFNTVATMGWDPETAQDRMANVLTSTYTEGARVDGVLSPQDGLSIGILTALADAGYGTEAQRWPIVTGQDAELDSVRSILAGEQFSTVFRDTAELARVAAEMVAAIVNGEEPAVNDTQTYENGVTVVPSYLLPTSIVVRDNVGPVLLDSGYWSAEDLGL